MDYSFRKLSDTNAFKMVADSVPGFTTLLSKPINPDLDAVSYKRLHETLDNIERGYKLPLSRVINEAIGNKDIIFVCSEQYKQLPTFLPIFLTVINGKVRPVVNLSNYAKCEVGDSPVKASYTVMLGMITAAALFKNSVMHQSSYINTTSLIGAFTRFYSKMMSKALDKQYGSSGTPSSDAKVKYLTAKFFLCYQLGFNPNDEKTKSLAMAALPPTVHPTVINEVDPLFNEMNLNNYDAFLSSLASVVPALSSLNTRGLTFAFIGMYGTTSLFAIEYFPYLIVTLIFTLTNSGLNSGFSIEQLIGKEDQLFIRELVKKMEA